MSDCYDFSEHPGWREQVDKTGGVTWDAWCSRCDFKIEGARWDNLRGVGISGNGRRLARCEEKLTVNGKTFVGGHRIYCSECVPDILK